MTRSKKPEEKLMFDRTVLEKYRSMSDAEKIQALKQAIHMDERPLAVLMAMLAILEPDRVERIFMKLDEMAS